MGKDEEALAIFRSMPGPVLPELVEANTAFALLRLGRREEGSAYLRRALQKYPNDLSGNLPAMEALLLAPSDPWPPQGSSRAYDKNDGESVASRRVLRRLRVGATEPRTGGCSVAAGSRGDRVSLLLAVRPGPNLNPSDRTRSSRVSWRSCRNRPHRCGGPCSPTASSALPPLQAEGADALVKSRALGIEQRAARRHVPVGLVERLADPLALGESRTSCSPAAARGPAPAGPPADRVRRDPIAGREDRHPLDDVLQLADVARPAVRSSSSTASRRCARPEVVAGAELLQEIRHELGDVLQALAQRGHADRDDVQPVAQIFRNPPSATSSSSCGSSPRSRDIDRDRSARRPRAQLAVLQHAQQLRLRRLVQVADLVEEDGAAVACSNLPRRRAARR